jgi:hypothetical protein
MKWQIGIQHFIVRDCANFPHPAGDGPMSSQTITVLSSIFDQEVLLEISFDFIPGQRGGWHEPPSGPEITITAADYRLARLSSVANGFVKYFPPRRYDYEPYGDVFEVPKPLWPALLADSESYFIEHVGEFQDAAE